MLFADALFNIFAGVFDVLNDVRQNIAVVLLFLYSIIPNLDAIIHVRMLLCESSIDAIIRVHNNICCYAKARCYYSCPYAVIPNLDAIICVHVLLCESSMLSFVSVCCYTKPRCYYSCFE